MNPSVDSPPGLNVGVNANNQITNTGFSYDAAGNSLQDGQGVGSHSYTWDAEERLVQVDSGSTWSYTYNALGQRVEWLQPGVNNELLYDPAGNLVGNWGSWSLVPLGSRNNWAMYINGKTVFSHPNNLGSSVMQTDFSGAVVQDMTYYPWGTVWQSAQAGYVPYFASMIYDANANKYLTTYRQFSPNLGRWLTPDPGGIKPVTLYDPQTWNKYAYVRDSPTVNTDPTGLWSTAIHDQIIDQVFQNILDYWGRQILKIASAEVDMDEGLSGAYKHGMSSPFQDASDAEGRGDMFITENLQNAVAAQMDWEGKHGGPDDGVVYMSSDALSYFGAALHTTTDRTSPWHRGDQTWWGPLKPGASLFHIAAERIFGPGEEEAISEARYEANLLWIRLLKMVEEARKRLKNRADSEKTSRP
jgi:RHS repeat-associated protein